MVTDYPEIKLYIDGQWTDGAGSRGDDVVNPATEEVLGRVPFAEPSDVDAAIAAAKEAFPKWRDAGPDFRSGILLKAAALLHQRADEIGRVMTMEEGKPLAEAAGEVHRAATGLQWNTEEGRRAYGRIIPSGPDEILSVRVDPCRPRRRLRAVELPGRRPDAEDLGGARCRLLHRDQAVRGSARDGLADRAGLRRGRAAAGGAERAVRRA